jgi:hypothetical protein
MLSGVTPHHAEAVDPVGPRLAFNSTALEGGAAEESRMMLAATTHSNVVIRVSVSEDFHIGFSDNTMAALNPQTGAKNAL